MSVDLVRRVFDEAPFDGTELLVLLALAEYADDTGCCWPSATTLARRVRRSKARVHVVLRTLEEAGWVITSGRHRSGTSKRWVRLPEQQSSPQDLVQPTGLSSPQDLVQPTGLSDVYSENARVQPTGQGVSSPQDTEPSMNHQIGTSSISKGEVVEASQSVTPTSPEMPESIRRFITEITPGLSDEDARRWQDVWHLAHAEEFIESPGITLRAYLTDCRRRELVPDPDRWFTRWHAQAQRWAREGIEKARQEATLRAGRVNGDPKWMERYNG